MRDEDVLSRLLESLRGGLPQKNFFAGFDGFVDNVTHVIERRINADEYIRIKTLTEYGRKIMDASGLSTTIEQDVLYKKTGGNGPIFTTAMLNMGQSGTYAGAVGQPVHEVFADLAARAKVYSLTEPALTYALEFDDGKAIVVTNLNTFKQVNIKNLLEVVGAGELKKIMLASELIAFVNWTNLINLGEILDYVIAQILPSFTSDKMVFFDLIDPVLRSEDDLKQVLSQIKSFAGHCNTVLSMNVKEARAIAKALKAYDGQDIERLAEEIGLKLGVYASVVHAIKSAVGMIGGKMYHADGAYCEKPTLLTGAGDNFNAGLCIGLLQGWQPNVCLSLGGMTSGYYVRYGRSGTAKQIEDFVWQWSSDNIK